MAKSLFGVVIALLPFAVCNANPLDDCTLQHMVGVTSDAAAKFVRQSCLGQISSTIPLENIVIATTGGIGQEQYGTSSAFYMTLENKSRYAITEFIVRIVTGNGSKSSDYRVTQFLQIYTGPGIVTGLPPDPASYMQIKPFSSVYFAFPVQEKPPAKDEKWSFQIMSVKGYLAATE